MQLWHHSITQGFFNRKWMYSRRRVFAYTVFLSLCLRLVCANDWVLASRQRQVQHRHYNDTRASIPGIYPYINPPKQTTTLPVQQSALLFHTHPLWATFISVFVIFDDSVHVDWQCHGVFGSVFGAKTESTAGQPADSVASHGRLLRRTHCYADCFDYNSARWLAVGLVVCLGLKGDEKERSLKAMNFTGSSKSYFGTNSFTYWITVDNLGNVVCALWTTSDLMLCTASILNLCLISVDRYLAVTQPLTYIAKRSRRRIFVYILIVWVCAFLVSSIPLIVFPNWAQERNLWSELLHSFDNNDDVEVSQNQLYQIYATVLSFYAPCIIMVCLYWKMWKAAKRLQLQDKLANKWSLTQPDENDNDHKTNKQQQKTHPTTCIPTKMAFQMGTLAAQTAWWRTPPRRLMHRPSSILQAIRVPLVRPF